MTLGAPRVAILASGGGGAAEAFIEATQDGRVAAEVGLVVCSRPPERAGVYARVNRLNARYGLDIETVEISARTHPDGDRGRGQTLAESAAIARRLRDGGYAHVALMGYMRIVTGDLLDEFGHGPADDTIYQARMTNSHPGPLPQTGDTFGLATAQRVLDLSLPASRHTVHLVAAGIDTGPVIAEHPVEVYAKDTAESLFRRVLAVERAALPYAIGRFLAEQRGQGAI